MSKTEEIIDNTVHTDGSGLSNELSDVVELAVITEPTVDGGVANKKYVDDNGGGDQIGDLTIGQTLTIDSWSFIGTAITINTAVAHNLIVGQVVIIKGLLSTTNTPFGRYTVTTVEDTDTITVTSVSTPTGSPTVSSATLKSGEVTTHGGFIAPNAWTSYAFLDMTTTPFTIKASWNVYDVVDDGLGRGTLEYSIPMDNNIVMVAGSSDVPTAAAQLGHFVHLDDSHVPNLNDIKFKVQQYQGNLKDRPDVLVYTIGGKD